jgi:hypothetical protein
MGMSKKDFLNNFLEVILQKPYNTPCCIDLGFKIFLDPGAHQRKIAPMASTKIAFYIYYLLIISPGITWFLQNCSSFPPTRFKVNLSYLSLN